MTALTNNSKVVLIILATFFSICSSFSQKKQVISINYGSANNIVLRATDIVGAGSVEGKGAFLVGVNYQKFKTENFSYQMGVSYSKNTVEITPSFYPEIDMTPKKKEIDMISLNFLGNYTFLKYAFVNGGVLLDYDMSAIDYSGIDSQSGMGLIGGIGGKYHYSNFELSVNPFISTHAIIPFKQANYQQHIWEAGITFGIGYIF